MDTCLHLSVLKLTNVTTEISDKVKCIKSRRKVAGLHSDGIALMSVINGKVGAMAYRLSAAPLLTDRFLKQILIYMDYI